MQLTLANLLSAGGVDAPAIGAPGRRPMTFGELRALVDATRMRLNGLGIGRDDRIAIVLDNGPEAAACSVACACAATTAPLNPAYRAEEFGFYLTDLRAAALIVASGDTSPAVGVAAAQGVRILELIADPDGPAGHFTLVPREPHAADGAARPGAAQADDVSLVLHTSGTTSRPKVVPLSQRNLCASAAHIRTTLRFTQADRGLNVMPLFHIHGLIAGVLAPLSAGSMVFCTPGFDALKFFAWMDESRPTWYTAVPTMHQAILARAATNAEVIARHPLRFVRSSSAPIPPKVIRELEEAFGAPLIEAYGMTEATHQIASNPLPPGLRKPGTVGVAAGPQVAVMAEDGRLLARGETGEIVIRGANVTAGYEGNAVANAAAFVDGWLRTGDQGVMDADGFLSITGRLKEIVNRGGEKIAPREVDEALLGLPGVAQAAAFAVPHPTLGEDLFAVVVRHAGSTLDDVEMRRALFDVLSPSKVPSRILVVDEIPKGPTGKVQRTVLHERLASVLRADFEPPRDGMEQRVADAFRVMVSATAVGRHDNFFVLGGDSIKATELVGRLGDAIGVPVQPADLFRHPTVSEFAALVEARSTAEARVRADVSALSDEEVEAMLRALEREGDRHDG